MAQRRAEPAFRSGCRGMRRTWRSWRRRGPRRTTPPIEFPLAPDVRICADGLRSVARGLPFPRCRGILPSSKGRVCLVVFGVGRPQVEHLEVNRVRKAGIALVALLMIGASSLSTLSVQAFRISADGRPSDPGSSGLHNPHFAVPQKPPALPGTTTSVSYLYADGQQAVSSGIGLAGQLTEPDPIVSPLDYHSLGEVT